MDKITYLAELAEGLARWVPERERRDILRYYAEYFEEAGPDREAEVVAELGDSWALSCRLAVEGGYVTQEQAASWTPPKRKRKFWMLAAGITAAVLLFTVASIASAASQVGRVVGRFVGDIYGDTVAADTADYGVTYEEPDWAELAELQEVYGIAFDEMSEMSGGFWTMEDGCLEAFDSIDVDAGLANIMVTEGDDYTLFIEQSAGLVGYELKWEVKNGTLKIRDGGTVNGVKINNWNDWENMFGTEQSSTTVSVTITVPETAVLDGIDVQTGLGSVFLSGMAAKQVEAETGLGNIACYDLRQVVKKLDLETGLGDVVLMLEEPYSGVEISVESGKGNVEAVLGCTEAECAYKLETGLGTVSVDGESRGSKAERKGNMPYRLEVESGWGDMNVCFYR